MADTIKIEYRKGKSIDARKQTGVVVKRYAKLDDAILKAVPNKYHITEALRQKLKNKKYRLALAKDLGISYQPKAAFGTNVKTTASIKDGKIVKHTAAKPVIEKHTGSITESLQQQRPDRQQDAIAPTVDLAGSSNAKVYATSGALASLQALEHKDANRARVIGSTPSGGYSSGKRVRSVKRSPTKVVVEYTSGEKEIVESTGEVTQVSKAGEATMFTATPKSTRSYFAESDIMQKEFDAETTRYKGEFKAQRSSAYAQGLMGIGIPNTGLIPTSQARNIQGGFIEGSSKRIIEGWMQKTGNVRAPYSELPETRTTPTLIVKGQTRAIQSSIPSGSIGAFTLGASLFTAATGRTAPALKFQGGASVLDVTPTTRQVMVTESKLSPQLQQGLKFRQLQISKEEKQQEQRDLEAYQRNTKDRKNVFENKFLNVYQPYVRAHEKAWTPNTDGTKNNWRQGYVKGINNFITVGGWLKPPQDRKWYSPIRLQQETFQVAAMMPKTTVGILKYGTPKAYVYGGILREQVSFKQSAASLGRQAGAFGIGVIKAPTEAFKQIDIKKPYTLFGIGALVSTPYKEVAKEREQLKVDYGGGLARQLTESERAFKEGTVEAYKRPSTYVLAATAAYFIAKGSFIKKHDVGYAYKTSTVRKYHPPSKTNNAFIRETTQTTGKAVRPTPSVINFIKTGKIIKHIPYKQQGVASATLTQGQDGKIYVRYFEKVAQGRVVRDVNPTVVGGKTIIKGGLKYPKFARLGKSVSTTKAVGQVWDLKTLNPSPAQNTMIAGGLKQYYTELHGTTTQVTTFGKSFKSFSVDGKSWQPSLTKQFDIYQRGISLVQTEKPYLSWEGGYVAGKITHKPQVRLNYLGAKDRGTFTEVYKPKAAFKTYTHQTDLYTGLIPIKGSGGSSSYGITHYTTPKGDIITTYTGSSVGTSYQSYTGWLKRTITPPKTYVAPTSSGWATEFRRVRVTKKTMSYYKDFYGKSKASSLTPDEIQNIVSGTGSTKVLTQSLNKAAKQTAVKQPEPYLSNLRGMEYKPQTPDHFVSGVDKTGGVTTMLAPKSQQLVPISTFKNVPLITSQLESVLLTKQPTLRFAASSGLYGAVGQRLSILSLTQQQTPLVNANKSHFDIQPSSLFSRGSTLQPVTKYQPILDVNVGFVSALIEKERSIFPPPPTKTTPTTRTTQVQDIVPIQDILPIQDITPFSPFSLIGLPPAVPRQGVPPPPPFVFPFLPRGFYDHWRTPYNAATGKRKKRYTPSATAIVFNLIGKAPSKKAKLTGLEFRPLLNTGRRVKTLFG